ncbi:hypothetical protein JCM5296_003214 [Sporobolomyces johnsonii]
MRPSTSMDRLSRSRRLSLPFSSSSRCQAQQPSTQPSSPPSHTNKSLPPIPLGEPPYMPMFRLSTSTPTRLVKLPPSPKPAGREEDLWTAPASDQPVASSSKLAHSRPTSRDSSRFLRRLNRWTGSRGELDFGCAGEWADGPADLGDNYYSTFHSGNRSSTSSSVDIPSWTHSRGDSFSSNFSVSTAASSIPASPTLTCPADHPSPLPYSRVPFTSRTAQRKRQTEEAPAVDAVAEYFSRMRLNRIEEDVSPRASICSGTARVNISSASHPMRPSSSAGTGLAVFGAIDSSSSVLHLSPSFDFAAKEHLAHQRSQSTDLEIEFIETGHTTFTPLTVDPSYSTAILLPEDVFFPDDTTTCYDIESDESAEPATSSSSCATVTTTLCRRTTVPEHDIGPALDELTTFFASSPSSPVMSRSQSRSPLPPPPISLQHRPPSRLSSRSPPSSPVLERNTKRQSASFAAAHRARMVKAGYASPTTAGPLVHYDWI